LKIPRSKSQLIAVAVAHDFYFHHTTRDSITLCRWIPKDEEDKLPLYAHTQIGVGCFVVNANNEVLAIKEKTGFYKGWKVPGGMVDPGEDLADAAVREVKEETGIDTKLRSIECFRSTHDALDGQTNLYFIVSLIPLNAGPFVLQPGEISEACWLPMEEFDQIQFRGVYRALNEVAMQNASLAGTVSSRSWVRHSLPVVFRRGNNEFYCSAESQLSAKCVQAGRL